MGVAPSPSTSVAVECRCHFHRSAHARRFRSHVLDDVGRLALGAAAAGVWLAAIAWLPWWTFGPVAGVNLIGQVLAGFYTLAYYDDVDDVGDLPWPLRASLLPMSSATAAIQAGRIVMRLVGVLASTAIAWPYLIVAAVPSGPRSAAEVAQARWMVSRLFHLLGIRGEVASLEVDQLVDLVLEQDRARTRTITRVIAMVRLPVTTLRGGWQLLLPPAEEA